MLMDITDPPYLTFQRIFSSPNAGVQCCAMAIANILRAAILPPALWTTNTLNENLIMGDTLYSTVLLKSRNSNNAHPIPESGYLELKNFDVVKEQICLHNTTFSIKYEDSSPIYGSLQDNMNVVDEIGSTLLQGIELLFTEKKAGVLTTSSKSYALCMNEQKFYFTDSHSCGPKGKSSANGTACIIQCDNIQELHRIARRATGSKNVQFTIDPIHVIANNDFLTITEVEPMLMAAPVTPPPIPQIEEDIIPVTHMEKGEVPISTSIMHPIDIAQPEVEDAFIFNEKTNELIRKTKDNIINEAHELKAEEFAWYYLFPYGRNGFKEKREVNITPLDYYQSRILGKDSRFQTNDYLFYALSMYEYYKVKSTIAACSKQIEGKQGKIEDIHLYLKNMRGSASYWRTAMNELIGQIRCLGPPTYFVTFSCNDLHWIHMRKALLIQDNRGNEDPEKLDLNSVQKLIEKYPVVVSRCFMLRVRALLKLIQQNHTIFGGKVTDYWWRIEFQDRGSPHLHMVVWIKNHPSFDTPQGINMINKVCSCKLPETSSPLYKIVSACQIHHHTKTCQKNTTAYCRFYFPRPANSETRIIQHTSDEFVRCGGRICLLQRDEKDKWVNNYNQILLRIWEGNMDIQPCGSNEAIAHYIAKYIAKTEPTELNRVLAEAVKQILREKCE